MKKLFFALLIVFATCIHNTTAEETGVTVTADDPTLSVEEIFISFSTDDDDILVTPIQITDLNAYVINLATNEEFKLSLGTTGDPYIVWGNSQTPGSETKLYWQGISTTTIIKLVESDLYQVYNTATSTGILSDTFPFTVQIDGNDIDLTEDDINITLDQTEVLPEPNVCLLFLIGAYAVTCRRRKN